MTQHWKGLVDRWNRPIEKQLLTQELAAPTLAGVRSPLTGYPGDGLNPLRLAGILREADAGDPVRYMELAQTVEERDLHYVGVLGTRRRAVSQLDITVEPASDSAVHQKHADRIAEWLKRDELADELFDLLDAVGRGYAFSEIIWDTSADQWEPARLEWRDQRYFRFDRRDLTTPLQLDEHGQERPLAPWKFIMPVIRAKSGIPLRAGLARIVAWAWMFKAFSNRDWAIFTQTYGQPVRIGRYGPNATSDDRDTLYNAVANIAGDCAAIIPESMLIEFVESKSIGASSDLYEKRVNWLDQQVSKAVLGQTATTDSLTGGLGSGKEHRQVQEDIERADAKQLAATINRDLVRPWIELEYPLEHGGRFPRLKIGRAEQTDVTATVDAVVKLVPLGLEVGQRQMREVVGLGAPDAGDELLTAPKPPPVIAPPATADHTEQEDGEAGTQKPPSLHAEAGPMRGFVSDPLDLLAGGAARAAAPAVATMLATVRAIVDRAQSLEEMRAMLEAAAAAGEIAPADLDAVMRQALLAAELAGRAEIGGGAAS